MTDAKQALQVLDAPQRQEMALDAIGRRNAIDDLVNKTLLVQEAMKAVMREGEHFGVIPGCGTKPALLKAGAEKLGMTFRLKANFDVQERDLGNGHREYSIRCMLSDGNMGVGSCSTMESKYRYRQGERKCPECGKATIITGKKEYGGGFLCFAKKGGCGAKFTDTDERILNQQVGRVEHDNPADFYNTALKMGKKRAHVDAIITATACSDIFTQDVEELSQNAAVDTGTPAPAPAKPQTAPAAPEPAEKQEPAPETIIPVCTVKMVSERSGAHKNGTPWTAYMILLNDGFSDMEVGTFSKTVSSIAKTLADTGETAEATIRTGNKQGTFELISILPIHSKETDDIPN